MTASPPWYDEQGQGEPLVLLHPGGADERAFAPNLDAWAAHFHVLTPDRRGHGPDVDGPITYEPMAQDIIAFLEAVVGGSAHLAGCSDGVPVALLWGSGFLWIKLALGGLSPLQIMLGRMVAGAAVMLAILAASRHHLPRQLAPWAHRWSWPWSPTSRPTFSLGGASSGSPLAWLAS